MDILRDVDEHGAGATGAGDVEGLLNDSGEGLEAVNQEIVLRDLPCDLHDGRFLERIAPHQMGRYLARDGHNRDGVHSGVGQSGHQVRGARSRGRQADAHLPGRSGVSLRGKDLALFVAAENGAYLRPSQRLVDFHAGTAGVAEDELNSLTLQGLHHDVRALLRFALCVTAPRIRSSRALHGFRFVLHLRSISSAGSVRWPTLSCRERARLH